MAMHDTNTQKFPSGPIICRSSLRRFATNASSLAPHCHTPVAEEVQLTTTDADLVGTVALHSSIQSSSMYGSSPLSSGLQRGSEDQQARVIFSFGTGSTAPEPSSPGSQPGWRLAASPAAATAAAAAGKAVKIMHEGLSSPCSHVFFFVIAVATRKVRRETGGGAARRLLLPLLRRLLLLK